MRAIVLFALTACLGAVALPAAGDPDRNERTASRVTDIKSERIVCEKITRIGTRIPERICRTESQIEAERAAAQKLTTRKQDEAARSGGLPPGVGGPG